MRLLSFLLASFIIFTSTVSHANHNSVELYLDGTFTGNYGTYDVYQPIPIDESYVYLTGEIYNSSPDTDVSLGYLSAYSSSGGLEVSSNVSDSYLSPYQSAYFTLRIKRNGKSGGYYSGDIRFSTSDEFGSVTYNAYIGWYVPSIPLSDVMVSGLSRPAGSNIYLGQKAPINNDYARQTVYVHNRGTGALNLSSGTLSISNGFEILQSFGSTYVNPGFYTSFEIGFRQNGRAPGWYGGQLTFYSNDSQANPYWADFYVEVPDRSWGFIKTLTEHYTTKPVINWTSSYGATSYDIMVDDEQGCTAPFVAQYTGVTGNVLTMDQSLNPGTYYLCGVARSTLPGAPPYAASSTTISIQLDKLFREFPNNSYTTWLSMDQNTYLLHFNNDYAVNGSAIPDSSLNPENANFHTKASLNAMRNGLLANTLYLDGDNSGVTLPNSTKLDPAGPNFSLGMWLQAIKTSGFQVLYEDKGPNSGNWIRIVLDNGTVKASIRDGSFKMRSLSAPNKINANQWYQVFVTNDASAATLFINGQSVDSASNTIGAQYMAGDKAPHIGGDVDTYSASEFNGFIDEFGFWKAAIPVEKIRYAYVNQYTYHDKNTPVVSRYTSSPKMFDGTNPDAIGYGAGWGLKDEYTVAFSVKPEVNQLQTQNGGNFMFGKFLAGVYYPIYCVYMNQTHALHGRFYCSQLRLGTNTDKRTVSSPYAIHDGSFHHIVVSLKGATLKLYLDGQLIKTITNALTDLWGRGPFIAGGRLTGDQFQGTMKNVKVFPKALSDSTISNLAATDR